MSDTSPEHLKVKELKLESEEINFGIVPLLLSRGGQIIEYLNGGGEILDDWMF